MKTPDIEARDEGLERDHRPSWRDLLLLPAAVFSLGAAAIHFAVAPEHFSEYLLFGLFFAGIGWFQAFWPLALVRFRTGVIAIVGIVVNLAAVALWVWTRVVALPIGPQVGEREPAGLADIAATGFEVLLVCLLVGLIVPGLRSTLDRRAPRSAWIGSIAWLVLVIWITTFVLAAHGDEIMVMTH